MSIGSVMPLNHPILCCLLLLLPSIFPSRRVFSSESAFPSVAQSIGASASVSDLPMNIQGWFPLGLSGLISTVQVILKSFLQHHSSKASILWHSAFFMVQLSHPYVTTGKIVNLIIWTFVGKVMTLLLFMLCRFVTAFHPRSQHLLISWLQWRSTAIL